MNSYQNQVAIITGATAGLSFAIASKLLQEAVQLALPTWGQTHVAKLFAPSAKI